MQLLDLYIEDYKILQDFRIKFSDKEPLLTDGLNVIIGENGAGKTTIVEALLTIFKGLYDCKKVKDISKVITKEVDFKFTLSYHIRVEGIIDETTTTMESRVDYLKITISNLQEQWLIVNYTNKELINEHVNNYLFNNQLAIKDILPKNTVLYYAGFDNRLSEKVEKFTYDYFYEWLVNVENQSKGIDINAPLFYFNPNQFNLLLFAIFCNEKTDIAIFLKEKFDIIGFTEINLKLKMPKWHRSNPARDYWGAKGILREAIIKLENASQEKEILKRSIVYSYFIPQVLTKLVGYEKENSFTKEKEIFQSLVAFDVMGLLDGIEITLVKQEDNKNIEISSRDLSEGEKQLLSIYGLKQILSTYEDSLFLFDEPDTFLHPKWKKEFFRSIYFDANGSKIEYGDFDIITTHSPEIIGNINSNTSLKRIVNGEIYGNKLFVKGRDYNSILYEAFNTEKSSEHGQSQLELFYEFLESKQLDKAKQKLNEIIRDRGSHDIETQKAIDNLEDYK